MARKKHGPGFWLCWPCAATVTNHPAWEDRMRILLPDGYRSKGGTCHRCKRRVHPGHQVAKVTSDAPLD